MPEPERDPGAVAEQLHNSLQAAMADGDHALLQGWVLVTEWVTTAGERVIDTHVSPDARLWDVAGYLRWASAETDAQIVENCADE